MLEAKRIASSLTQPQSKALIDHVANGRMPIDVRVRTFAELSSKNLVRGERNVRPKFSMLTEIGREVAAVILGRYADALDAAGFEINPPAVLAAAENDDPICWYVRRGGKGRFQPWHPQHGGGAPGHRGRPAGHINFSDS